MKKLFQWISDLWKKAFKYYDWLRPRALAAIEVVNLIKTNLVNFGDLVVSITPSKKDDEFMFKAKKALEVVVPYISSVEGLIGGNENFEDALKAFIEFLQKNSKLKNIKFWVELAAEILKAVVGNNMVTDSGARALTQTLYGEKYEA